MNKKKILYMGSLILFIIILFVIIVSINKNKVNEQFNVIADTSEVNLALGKTVSEQVDLENNEEEYEEIAEIIDTRVKEQKQEESIQEIKQEIIEDPTFILPVDGEIIKEYSQDKLVYSDTLEEWVTHLGMDIKAEKTTVIKASADGIIKSIKNDPRYGLSVEIEHANGFSTRYSSLLSTEFIKENEWVVQGQTIGTVGNTAVFEILDGSHLHFEILKESKQINPSLYIKE